MIEELYDYILIDTPPIISMSDAAIAAKQCDGAILVIESEAVSRRDAMKAKEQLTKSGCKLLGAVLNKVDMKKEKCRVSMLFVGTSIIHPSTEGVFLLCNILDLLIYSKMNEIRCFVMQSDRRLSGEKGVRECIGRTVTAG